MHIFLLSGFNCSFVFSDIDECADPRRNYCGKNCINLEGSFFCSDNSKVQHDKAIIIGRHDFNLQFLSSESTLCFLF